MKLNDEDVLEQLFVNEAEVNRGMIVDILGRYLRLTNDGHMVFLQEFNSLTNEKKVLLVVLARKVLSLKGIADEFISPSEVQYFVGLPKGSVNPALTNLAASGFLRNVSGKYQVPAYAIVRIKEMFR